MVMNVIMLYISGMRDINLTKVFRRCKNNLYNLPEDQGSVIRNYASTAEYLYELIFDTP